MTAARQRGAALLAAMITVALVATLAAAALWRQWRGVEVEGAERARVQAAWILTGALDWGRLILGGDLLEDSRNTRLPAADHLGEPWAVPLAEARLSTFLAAGEDSASDTGRDAFLSGEVTDLQSRLNLMNLIAGSPKSQLDALMRFERLFNLLNLRNSDLAALQRALSRANAAQKGELNDGSDVPLMPRRFDQLAWLGLSSETLDTLRPYATLLPLIGDTPTPINLNTASAEVIFAAVQEIDAAGAQRIVVQRTSAALRNTDNIRRLANLPDSADLSWTSVTSNFFEIRGRLRLDDVALEEMAVVQRTRTPRRVSTLWRERTALTVPLVGSP